MLHELEVRPPPTPSLTLPNLLSLQVEIPTGSIPVARAERQKFLVWRTSAINEKRKKLFSSLSLTHPTNINGHILHS